MAHSKRYKPLSRDENIKYWSNQDVSTGGGGMESQRGPRLFEMDTLSDVYWAAKEVGKWAGKQVASNVVGPTKPIPKRNEPPFKSLVKEPKRSVTSTATEGQKRRWGQQAALNKQAAQRGLSARRNAADISMNNPPVVTDSSGHRVYNGKRVHK